MMHPLFPTHRKEIKEQAEKLKSREMKEGWMKNEEGWMMKDDDF